MDAKKRPTGRFFVGARITAGSAGRWPALDTAWAGQRPALPIGINVR